MTNNAPCASAHHLDQRDKVIEANLLNAERIAFSIIKRYKNAAAYLEDFDATSEMFLILVEVAERYDANHPSGAKFTTLLYSNFRFKLLSHLRTKSRLTNRPISGSASSDHNAGSDPTRGEPLTSASEAESEVQIAEFERKLSTLTAAQLEIVKGFYNENSTTQLAEARGTSKASVSKLKKKVIQKLAA